MDLSSLNPAQREAVLHTDGPCCVLAGAGSGKTRVLTQRIGRLVVDEDVPARNIVAVTFTRKAAGEMAERIEPLIGAEVEDLNVGTFHSLCYQILKDEWRRTKNKGYEPASEWWQRKAIGNIIYDEMDWGQDVGAMLSWISWQKNNIRGPEDELLRVPHGPLAEKYRTMYRLYEERKEKEKKLDFDDMLLWCYWLLMDKPPVRARYSTQYRYILVDEFQDTCLVQYEILKMWARPQNNLFVVGDDYQCWHSDSIVLTPSGPKRVVDLQPGEMVQSMVLGKPSFVRLTGKSRPKHAQILKITTESGACLRVTPEHKCFTSLPELGNGATFVYMMYRHDKGFRIGITRGGLSGVLAARTNPECPERLWLLSRHFSKPEAFLRESKLSLKYSVPTSPFFHNGRNLALGQKEIDVLFDEFGKNGMKLLQDLGLDFNYPHYVASGTTREKFSRSHVYIYLNLTCKGKCLVSYEKLGIRIRKIFNGDEAYLNARAYAEEIAQEHGANMVLERYCHKKREHLTVVPAIGLFPTAKIPVVKDDGQAVLESIVSVEPDGESEVYHLEAADTGIVVADRVVSHNSIYGWRAARVEYIINFAQDWPGAKTIMLETNYRSSSNIVDISNRLIKNNLSQAEKTCHAHRGDMGEPFVLISDHEDHEAEQIVEEIRVLTNDEDGWEYGRGHCAILFRVNAQARALEDALISAEVPYIIFGGTGFYARKEVRDILAYLRILEDPKDEESIRRIINVPTRYLGKVFMDRAREYASREGISIFKAVRNCPEAEQHRYRGVKDFLKCIDHMKRDMPYLSPAQMVQLVRTVTRYDDWLAKEDGIEDEADNHRTENLNALVKAAQRFSSLKDFLFYTEQASSKPADPGDASDKVQLMTLHRSKGLEFPVVFLAGMNQGLLPHKRSIEYGLDGKPTPESVEEERRLAYVGMTRAMDMLYLSTFKEYQDKQMEPSMFLKEVWRPDATRAS